MTSLTMTATSPMTSSFTASGGRRPNVQDMSVKEIKDLAKKEIPAILKAFTPSNSLLSARKLGESAIAAEGAGELKLAFYQYQRVIIMLSHVANQVSSQHLTQIVPQFEDVFNWTQLNVTPRSKKLEERLLDMEADRKAEHGGQDALPSVADRIRSLQENGLMASATAAKSRRSSNHPSASSGSMKPSKLSLSSAPMSPTLLSPPPTTFFRPQASSPPPILLPSSPPAPSSPGQTPHAFVSLASLGPPSPTSSPPSSPLISHSPILDNLASLIRAPSPEFEQVFPPLEEWEASLNGRFPTVPTTLPGAPRNKSFPNGTSRGTGITGSRAGASYSTYSPPSYSSPMSPGVSAQPPSLARRFSLIPMDRPASTPPRPLPDSPTSADDVLPVDAVSGAIHPRDIYSLHRRGKKILFLDLRTRAKWDAGRVRGEAVCIEPTFGRDGLTLERIVSSLELSPKEERLLFQNRRSFALVVIYEDDEPTELSRSVIRALWDNEYRQENKLKQKPVMMSGGFSEWRRELGEGGVEKSAAGSVASGSSGQTRRGSVVNGGSGGSGDGKLSRQTTGASLRVSPALSVHGTGGSKHSFTVNGIEESFSEKLSAASLPPPSPRPSSDSPIPPSLQPGFKQSPMPPSYSTLPPSPQPSPAQHEFSLPPPRALPSVPQPLAPLQPPDITSLNTSAPPTPSQPNLNHFTSNPVPSTLNGSGKDQFWVYKGSEKPPRPKSPPSYDFPPVNPLENEDALSALPDPNRRISRKPALNRPISSPHLSNQPPQRNGYDQAPPPLRSMAPSGSISYPSQPVRAMPPPPGSAQYSQSMSNGFVPVSSFQPQPQSNGIVSPPPQASINPSPISRRRSDYMGHAPAPSAYSSPSGRVSIDYPDFSSQHSIRPPPPVAPATSDRQDYRSRITNGYSQPPTSQPSPRANGHSSQPSVTYGSSIPSDYPVMYWSDYQVSTSGLKNLGNTCYMNSTIQCLSATYPFANYFTDGRFRSSINKTNKMSSKGEVAYAFANLLHQMRQGDMPYLTPHAFRKSICTHAPQFSGSDQHDTEEFLNFLLDGLHEDLNKVMQRTSYKTSPEREAELEVLPQQIASEQEWRIYRMSNNSIVVDYFQGQFRNRLQCLTCGKTSTTYNPFTDLALPIPAGRGVSKVTLQQCLDAFVREEIMEKSEAWHCPNCKTLRKASKQLSISRLPAVLIVVLKRFSFKGPFTDKLETLVEFPIKELDLTNYMPPPLPPGPDQSLSYTKAVNSLSEDPSIQVPPYKYDLFGVTNHYGSLSNGHYTAFIAGRGGWQYCDDSRVVSADTRDIVSKAAYVLYYKRTRP